MVTFKSKYGLGELIETKNIVNKDGPNLFGHVRMISFRKSDAVNYTADYEIEIVNKGEVVCSINEQFVLNVFGRVAGREG